MVGVGGGGPIDVNACNASCVNVLIINPVQVVVPVLAVELITKLPTVTPLRKGVNVVVVPDVIIFTSRVSEEALNPTKYEAAVIPSSVPDGTK